MSRKTKVNVERTVQVEADDTAIRLRAYQIFESRGGVPGHEMDDWAQAERELRRPSGQ